MDALSEVLRVIRLTGGVFLEAEFTAPWNVLARIAPEDVRMIMSAPAAVVGFHYMVEGNAKLSVEGEALVELAGGEIVLMPHNDVHLLGSDLALPPVQTNRIVQLQGEGALAKIDYGGGGEKTRVICGFVGSEARRHPLQDALPRVLKLDLRGRPAADWITTSFRFAAQEVAASRPGSATVLAKLSELLFVEAVREYMAGLPAERTGWLAGLRDPAVGRALAMVHARPEHAWTAETLATEAHLSRSAFADRFTVLLGVPPMTYLTSWRMQLAAQRLRETRQSIAQIAAAVGYESEATFSRAFKREMAVAPGQYRSQSA